ncbi:MAG: hypothetical protein WCA20_26535 [Candidatus Sulfotelmatobacter sp.]
MTTIPPFDADGLLPPRDYELSFDELRQSILVSGPGDPIAYPSWDQPWRERLVNNLEILTRQLWQVGIRAVFADGSFAEDKEHPNDIDGYFECDLGELMTGELERRLNLLDPSKVWTWDPASRKPYRGYPKKQLPMWHKYRVELYPMFPVWVSVAAFSISTGTNWSFHLLFVSAAATASRAESSKSSMEVSHDSQRS